MHSSGFRVAKYKAADGIFFEKRCTIRREVLALLRRLIRFYEQYILKLKPKYPMADVEELWLWNINTSLRDMKPHRQCVDSKLYDSNVRFYLCEEIIGQLSENDIPATHLFEEKQNSEQQRT